MCGNDYIALKESGLKRGVIMTRYQQVICHNTRSQSLISLEIPLTKTNIGKIAFKFFASHKWNTVQVELKLTKYLSVNQFKSLLDAKDVPQCCCFK